MNLSFGPDRQTRDFTGDCCQSSMDRAWNFTCGRWPANPDGPLFGRKLDREAALQHPRSAEFRDVADFVLEHDPLVRGHVHGR